MCGGEVGFGTAFGSLGFNRRERGVLPAYRQAGAEDAEFFARPAETFGRVYKSRQLTQRSLRCTLRTPRLKIPAGGRLKRGEATPFDAYPEHRSLIIGLCVLCVALCELRGKITCRKAG